MKGWVLTRYEHVKNALLDPRFSAERMESLIAHVPESTRGTIGPLAKWIGLWAVFKDPPDHTRLRGLMSHAFTPVAIQELRPKVESLTERFLDQMVPRGRMDIIADLAYPLPITVIGDLLGLPPGDSDRLKTWSDELAYFVGGALTTADKYERSQEGVQEMAQYFSEAIDHERKSPENGLIGQMIQSIDRGLVSHDEVVGTCILVLFAGHETTTNLISNGIWSLLQNPSELAALRETPSLIESAVEEILRYEGPAQSVARVATQDIEIHDKTIKRGERVFLMIGAANRDPRVFQDPDRFDIQRQDNPHIAFGMGLHYCIGAPLARLEGQIAIGRILARCGDLKAEIDAPEWLDSLTFRGFRSLPVTFHPLT